MEVIKNQDVDSFLNMFESNITSSKFSEIGASSILEDWASNDAEYYTQIANALDEENFLYSIDDASYRYGITIQSKSHMIFFTTYYLDTNTSKVEISAENSDDIIYMNSEKIGPSDLGTNFFPGRYEFEASRGGNILY